MSVPAIKKETFLHTSNVDAVSIAIPNARDYTRFTVQVLGFTVGTTLVIKGSLDGATFSPLDATATSLPTITAAAAGLLFTFEIFAPIAGGLLITGPISADDGKVVITMCGSLHNTNR